jgi:hypothetical protein
MTPNKQIGVVVTVHSWLGWEATKSMKPRKLWQGKRVVSWKGSFADCCNNEIFLFWCVELTLTFVPELYVAPHTNILGVLHTVT